MSEKKRYTLNWAANVQREDQDKPMAEATLKYRYMDYEDITLMEDELFIKPMTAMNNASKQLIADGKK